MDAYFHILELICGNRGSQLTIHINIIKCNQYNKLLIWGGFSYMEKNILKLGIYIITLSFYL